MEVKDARNRKEVMSIPGEQVKWAGKKSKPAKKTNSESKKAAKNIVKSIKKNNRKNARAKARAKRQDARAKRKEARASRRAARKSRSGQERANAIKMGKLAKKNATSTTAKSLKEKKELKLTGKVRVGAKSIKATKGGAYASYDKKSAAAASFRKAYAKAKKGSTFTWDNRKYKK